MIKLIRYLILSLFIVILIIFFIKYIKYNKEEIIYFENYKFVYNGNVWSNIEIIEDNEINNLKHIKIYHRNNNIKITINLSQYDEMQAETYIPIRTFFRAPKEYYLEEIMIQDFFEKEILSKKVLIKCSFLGDCEFYEEQEDGFYLNYRVNLLGYKKSNILLSFRNNPTEQEIEEVIELIEDIHNAEKVK